MAQLMCWHVVVTEMLSRLRLSNPLAVSATEAGECELPCGALDVVEDASISCCWEFPSWHFRGSHSHVRMGRQELQAKRSSEITYRAGQGLLGVWLSLGISVPLCDVECCNGK